MQCRRLEVACSLQVAATVQMEAVKQANTGLVFCLQEERCSDPGRLRAVLQPAGRWAHAASWHCCQDSNVTQVARVAGREGQCGLAGGRL